jgi:sugar (pentulose or hexulose) kinase
MVEPLLVGLDVGTTSTKAVVLTRDGREIAHGRSLTPWTFTPDGAGLEAPELATAVRTALAQALAAAPEAPIAGVGVASMAEAGVLLDAAGRPVAPVIAWHDRRDHLEVAELATAVGVENFETTTGLPLRGQWSLTKHRWLTRHWPSAASAVRRLNIAEWIVHDLGGDQASEPSLASRTGWLRLRDRDWWAETLAWSGASERLLPPLRPAGEPWGAIITYASDTRLVGAALTVAGHDHQAASVGVGAAAVGDELDSCGTAEALVRTVAAGLPDDAVGSLAHGGITVGWHVLHGRWCLLGATEGGLTLGRTLRQLGFTHADLSRLDEAALALESTPVRIDHEETGLVLSGVGDAVGPAQVWRAALEQVTEEAAGLHQLMSRISGPAHGLVATGGWSRSEGLMRIKNRLLGPVARPPVNEAGARGAALLAGLAAGIYRADDELPRPRLEQGDDQALIAHKPLGERRREAAP